MQIKIFHFIFTKKIWETHIFNMTSYTQQKGHDKYSFLLAKSRLNINHIFYFIFRLHTVYEKVVNIYIHEKIWETHELNTTSFTQQKHRDKYSFLLTTKRSRLNINHMFYFISRLSYRVWKNNKYHECMKKIVIPCIHKFINKMQIKIFHFIFTKKYEWHIY